MLNEPCAQKPSGLGKVQTPNLGDLSLLLIYLANIT